MTAPRPKKTRGHSQAEQIKHLARAVAELKTIIERHATDLLELTMTAQDLATAITALQTAVANLPLSPVPLITQEQLDAAVQGVTEATSAVIAKTPPLG